MNVTKETVTPKKAMEWLKRNVNNRPLSLSTVTLYRKAMEAGKWKLNGDCIRFNGNGDMLDGQHRLTACIEAGKPFDTYVARGVDHEAFDTIDQGRKRTIGDVFARQGRTHYITLASAVRYQWGYEGQQFYGSMRADEANAILEAHPEIVEAVQYARDLCGKGKKLLNPGMLAFLIYATGRSDQALSIQFWKSVMDGEGLTKTMAAYWLRERLISNISSVAKVPPITVCALAIKAWNATKNKQQCKTLRWSEAEEFPRIV